MDGRRPGFIQRALSPCGRRDFISRPSVGRSVRSRCRPLQLPPPPATTTMPPAAWSLALIATPHKPSRRRQLNTALSCTSAARKFHLRRTSAPDPNTRYRPPRGRETICPAADGSSARGGSTSVRGRVRSPHISGGRRWLSCRQPACL